MKLVAPLMEAERITLLEARDQGPTAPLRRRVQAVELRGCEKISESRFYSPNLKKGDHCTRETTHTR